MLSYLSFRFGMHDTDQFHFYFFAFPVIPILLNFDFRGIWKIKSFIVLVHVLAARFVRHPSQEADEARQLPSALSQNKTSFFATNN